MLEHVDSLILKNHGNIFHATIQLILGWKKLEVIVYYIVLIKLFNRTTGPKTVKLIAK